MKDVIIIGGGLAGLVNAIQLSKAGLDVLLIEKKTYPFHKVCGEYISNEVVPFLQALDIYPSALRPSTIRNFMLTSVSGKVIHMPLDLGGFGISRYQFDNFLFQKALSYGTEAALGTQVLDIHFQDNLFKVEISGGEPVEARLVIGAFGKQSRIDKQLHREFLQHASPYLGVKYHVRTNFSDNCVALHNFEGGYCGIVRIEDGIYNVCYLGRRETLRKYKSIANMEQEVLCKNPFLRDIFQHSEFLSNKPEVINAFSFAPKNPVEDHVLMSGDAAGLITPLCGNGMALAIHSAKFLSEIIIKYHAPSACNRTKIEKAYRDAWYKNFSFRLKAGRAIQRLFGNQFISQMAVHMAQIKPVAQLLMRQTHGKPF